MALFKSIPAVSTQKDTTGPMKKKPSGEYKEENLKAKPPISDEEAENALAKEIKPLVDEPDPVVEDDFVMPLEEKEESKPNLETPLVKEEPKAEPKEDSKENTKPKKVVLQKPVVKEAPKKEEPKPEVKEEVKKEEPKKVEVKEEPKEELEEVKALEETKPLEEPKEEEKPLTLAERRMLNLQKAREARLKQQEKENNTMAQAKQTTQEEKAKKPAPKPKKAVDMSKMVMTTKKPAAATSGKTVYHVSKRGETREDRVWKVFIQESNKVIKLFDYQEEALEYAKQLAKNKNDGSYVILHGLNGKIRKF